MQAMLLAVFSRNDLIICGLMAVLVVGSFVATTGEGWESNVAERRMDSSDAFWSKMTIRGGAIMLALQLFVYLAWSH
jgi:hypothetical protein